MDKIALIGTSHLEENLVLEGTYEKGGRNEGKLYSHYGGTMRNLAHNLALMGFPVSFCTKLGQDMDAVRIWNELNDLGVLMFGPTINLKTPRKLTIIPKNENQTIFWDKPKDFFFNKDDILPITIFNEAEISLTDIRDDQVLEQLVTKATNTKWIVSHFVPNKKVLSKLHGLVINYADALNLGKPSDFERICYRLCVLGPKWVVINMNSQGAYLYQNQTGTHFVTKCKNTGYFNGCYSAFLSGLVAALSLHYPIDKAVNIALTAQGVTYKTPNLINPKIKDLFKKKNPNSL